VPTYEITAPDGKTYEVTGPGSADDALKHIQSLHGKPVPAAEPTWGDRGREFLQGGKARLDEMALGLKGLLPQGVQDFGDRIDRATGRPALTKATAVQAPDTWAGTAGGIGADILTTAGPAAGLARAASVATRALPMATGKRLLAEAGLNLGGQAALGAALTPDDRATAGALSAAGGVLGAGLQRVAGGLVKPVTTPQAVEMMRRGIQVTPGQAMGGAALDTEKKLTSLPLAGNRIRAAHERANEEYFRQTAGDVVGGLPANARAAVAGAGDGTSTMVKMREVIGEQYDSALGQVPHVPIDATDLLQKSVGIVNSTAMSEASKEQVLKYVTNNVLNRVPGASPGAAQNLSGDAAKAIESDLRAEASKYLTSSTAEERNIGKALSDIHGRFRDALNLGVDAVDPQASRVLRNADQAWRAFLPLDQASASIGAMNAGGTPQPRALLNSLKALDKSQNDNALRRSIAQGRSNTPYDRLVQNQQLGSEVFGAAVPDSGTTGRWLAGSALGIGLGGAPAIAGAAAGYAGVAAAYSRLGSRLLTQGIAPQQVEKLIQAAAQRGIPEEALLAQIPNATAAAGRVAE
jgi:hypothetical protein